MLYLRKEFKFIGKYAYPRHLIKAVKIRPAVTHSPLLYEGLSPEVQISVGEIEGSIANGSLPQ